MYIVKNALRNISRAKGRSILIGIIVVIIAFSMCIGLCIRQSASNAKEEALADMNITAQISPNREAAMDKAGAGEPGTFDKSQLKEMMGTSLSLEQLEKYAKAKSVKSFYYTLSAGFDGSGSLEAYTTSDSADGDDTETSQNAMPGRGMMSSGDFTLTGYSSDEAMTDFTSGVCTIEEGNVFEEGTEDMVCIISDELAEYNDLSVGDTVKLENPDDEDQVYKLKITGIYKNSQASASAAGGPGKGGFTDPANNIYTSYNTLNTIVEDSEVTRALNGTYVVGDTDAYEAFSKEVEELGLSEDYVVSSTDLSQYEQNAQPLENLSKFAGYFLIVILIIGAIVLIVLNIFSTRERKYEIGVLAAIGMKKGKVARLFLTEILVIALAGVIIGGGIGAAVSVPVTNSLLESQIESQQSNMEDRNASFGRDFNGGGAPSGEAPSGQTKGAESSYISSVSSSVNVSVLLQLLAACILLALAAGTVSVTAIMRYEPLQILANRD